MKNPFGGNRVYLEIRKVLSSFKREFKYKAGWLQLIKLLDSV